MSEDHLRGQFKLFDMHLPEDGDPFKGRDRPGIAAAGVGCDRHPVGFVRIFGEGRGDDAVADDQVLAVLWQLERTENAA